MIINWTEEKKEEILKLIENFINEHQVTCGESVMQCDNPQIEAPVLVADIVDILKPDYED